MYNKRKKKLKSFLSTQIKYSIFIISICAFMMSILSYNFIREDAIKTVIETNNEMLYQYRNSIDSLIINNFSVMSLMLLEDLKTKPELKYYINNPLEGKIVDTLQIYKHIITLKNLNPMICSVSIFYENNKLLVTTDYIRYSMDNHDNDKVILYHTNLIKKITDEWDARYAIIADTGRNVFPDTLPGAKEYPENVINIIRIAPDNQGSYASVIFTIDANIMHKMIQKYTPNNLDSIIVVDESNKIISHTESKYIGANTSEFAYLNNLYSTNSENGNTSRQVNKIPNIISYQTSETSGWKYIALTPISKIYMTTQSIFKIIIFVTLFTIVLCLIISLFAAKFLVKPIRQIAQICNQNPFLEDVQRESEFSLIINTLDGMAEIVNRKVMEIKETAPMRAENFTNWLFAGKMPNADDIYRKMNNLKIEFIHKRFCILAVKIKSKIIESSSSNNISVEYEKIKTAMVLKNELNMDFQWHIVNSEEDKLILLVNYDCSEELLSGICRQIIDVNSNEFAQYIAIGRSVDDIIKIADSYKDALIGVEYSYLYPEKNIFFFKDIENYENSKFTNILLINNFMNSLKSENYGKIISDFDSIIDMLRRERCSLEQLNSILVNCLSVIYDFVSDKTDKTPKLMRPMENFTNITNFSIYVKSLVSHKFMSYQTIAHTNNNLINDAKEFIRQNLDNFQLSLEAVAKHLGVSPNYFSRVFHNECDITFVAYITSLKMQLSRSLLLETNMKIAEISRYLGYSNPQYFIKKFKTNFGITPNAYKHKYKDDLANKGEINLESL